MRCNIRGKLDDVIYVTVVIKYWIVGRLSEEQVLPPPEFGVAFDSRYLHGLADVDENMVILVNIESLITSEELGLVATESVKDDA